MSPIPETSPKAETASRNTPEAVEVERSRLATDPDSTLTDARTPQPHTSVEWVRPTDLAARGAGTTLGRGTELPEQLRAAVKEFAHQQRGTLGQRLAERGEALEPTTGERTRTPALEREGVSR